MLIDDESKKSLDFQSIWNRIDVKTPYGKIHKDKAKAYKTGEEENLREELAKLESHLEYIGNKKLMREVEDVFAHIKDIRSSVKRARDKSTLTEVELFEIKNFIHNIERLGKVRKKYKMGNWEDMKIYPMEDLTELLDPEATGMTSFYIYDSYSKELEKIRSDKRDLDEKIKKEKKAQRDSIKEELGIELRVDGTVIISKSNEELIHKVKASQKLAYNSETYMNIKYLLKPTEEVKQMDAYLDGLRAREEREELKIRQALSEKIGSRSKILFKNMASLGRMDFVLGKASFGKAIGGVRPKIIEEHKIEILDGRHIQVEENLKAKGLDFLPISIELDQGATCITGANMGGKTISLKLVGGLTAMAQYGLLVPAKEMTLGLSNFIKTSIGDLQSTDQGLSSFGGEIKLIQEAIERSHEKGLILIDELARGTNPKEGYAISKAIVDYLKDKNSISLLTTHYDNIGTSEGVKHLQVRGLSHMDFDCLYQELKDSGKDEMDIVNSFMDYRLEEVESEVEVPQEALNIARIMGLDRELIKLAEKNLKRS